MTSYFSLIRISLILLLSYYNVVKSEEPEKQEDLSKEYVGHEAPSSKMNAHLHEKSSSHDDKFDHQAILGSQKAAEEYGDLSPEEAKKRLKVLARDHIDKNKDGFVTEEELTDWVKHSLISLDKEETEERFDEIDADKDGFITWGEYIQESFGVEPEDMKLMTEDRKYFGAADSDRDMKLSKDEFAAFQNPEHFNTLKEKDIDKDGKIDLKEFLGDTFDQPSSEWYITEKTRFTEEYDKDQDGFLTGNEIKEWLVPDIHQTARQEARHLIKMSDTDKDGELSIQEIVEAHKTFVGSEATSYGEKLVDIQAHEEL
ncbi:EF-hand domain pair domain-containing protein [Ditylenchus destructor]|nr:EF-hand domain pair domain-containing protein [Ditylenchus destructor]